MTGTTSYVDAL